MHKWIFGILLITISLQSVGQITTDEISFIEKIIREKKPEGEIVYTNHIDATDAYKVLLKLKSEIRVNDSTNTFITITKQERKQIEKKLEQYTKPYWNSNLFSDSKMIEEKNVMSYFKTVYNQYSETLSNPNNSQVDKSKLMNNSPQPFVFEFTPLLYLRDKTLCLVFVKSLCGNNCGSSELTFYNKVNDKWSKLVLVTIE